MSERIEFIVENVDIQLKTIDRVLRAFGELVLSFNCRGCNLPSKLVLKYDGYFPTTIHKCEYCEEEYLIHSIVSIDTQIKDKEAVEVYRQLTPVVEKIKEDYGGK